MNIKISPSQSGIRFLFNESRRGEKRIVRNPEKKTTVSTGVKREMVYIPHKKAKSISIFSIKIRKTHSSILLIFFSSICFL